ncbi:MAG: hypothetical protein LBT29_08280, partial [Flavobacteriaceae bacterium]|nr:hypothetical protein [Flavobacteriaceae bacterium]
MDNRHSNELINEFEQQFEKNIDQMYKATGISRQYEGNEEEGNEYGLEDENKDVEEEEEEEAYEIKENDSASANSIDNETEPEIKRIGTATPQNSTGNSTDKGTTNIPNTQNTPQIQAGTILGTIDNTEYRVAKVNEDDTYDIDVYENGEKTDNLLWDKETLYDSMSYMEKTTVPPISEEKATETTNTAIPKTETTIHPVAAVETPVAPETPATEAAKLESEFGEPDEPQRKEVSNMTEQELLDEIKLFTPHINSFLTKETNAYKKQKINFAAIDFGEKKIINSAQTGQPIRVELENGDYIESKFTKTEKGDYEAYDVTMIKNGNKQIINVTSRPATELEKMFESAIKRYYEMLIDFSPISVLRETVYFIRNTENSVAFLEGTLPNKIYVEKINNEDVTGTIKISGKYMKSKNAFSPISQKKLNKLVDRLKKSGLANDVIVDAVKMREALDKELGKENAARFMAEYDYRMSHNAPGKEGNNSGDNLSDIFPEDLYSSKGLYYYGNGDKAEAQSMSVIRSMRNKPDKEVTIYRAVPKGVKEINSGDWVSISREYAKEHGESYLDGEYDIISMKVKANQIFNEGYLAEWGVRFMTTKKGEVYGFVTSDGTVYLDPAKMNANTPIHEFGHLWNSFVKENNPELYKKGTALIKQSEYWKQVNNNPAYSNLSEDGKVDEALAMAIGDKGELQMQTQDILSFARLKNWLNDVWNWIKGEVELDNKTNIESMTLNDFTDRAVSELTSGKEIDGTMNDGDNKYRNQSNIEYADQRKYDFDVSGITAKNAAEMQDIKETAVTNGTFMKAPNGKTTKLNERQWLQVRTGAFKKWFGDWEDAAKYDYFLSEDYVSTITGNEFQKDETSLTDKVTKYYLDKYEGKVERAGLGTVILDRNGVSDSISHGIGRTKSAAFAAVPEIIKDGIIIDHQTNWKGRGKDTYVIAAPVKIGDKGYAGIVVVTQTAVKNKFYLHEVILQESLQNGGSVLQNKGLLSKTGALPTSETHTGDLAKIIQNLETAKNNSSKVVDENGEPIPVSHSTNADFTTFIHQQKNDAGWLGAGYYFFGDRSLDGQYGKNVVETFLNVRNPYYASYEEVKELSEENDNSRSQEFTSDLKSEGYDGVYFNGNLNQEWNVFSPSQIKSATDNNGNFDKANNDIRFQTAYIDDIDTKYKEAIKNGDTETAQEMLDELADIAGYEKVEYGGIYVKKGIPEKEFENIRKDYIEMYEAGSDLKQELKDYGIRAKFTHHNEIVLYHGTSPENAESIRKNGSNSNLFLGNSKREVEKHVTAKRKINDIVEITIDPR